jgi:hypothetical protein
MLETYLSVIETVWGWIKTIFMALTVVLPSVIILVYKVATRDTDISTIAVAITVVTSILWAPIPLYPRFKYEYRSRWGDYYMSFLKGAGMALLVIPYLGGCLLPVLASALYCYFTDYRPGMVQFIVMMVVTVLWGPGAHHLMMKFMDRVIYRLNQKEKP